jgi:hypothetical protein
MEEIWKSVVGFEGRYEISNLCRVKRLSRRIKGGHNQEKTGRVLKESIMTPYLYPNGYYGFVFGRKHMFLHRMLAEAFIPNPDNKPEVDHKDRNRTNNSLSNLRWSDRVEQNNNRDLSNMIKQYSKPILQCKDGKVIKEWSSMAEADRNGYSKSKICLCCQGKKAQYKGYEWKYKGEE